MPDMDSPAQWAGEFVFEEIYGFNLLRPPECKDMRKAAWLCIRKMVDKKKCKCHSVTGIWVTDVTCQCYTKVTIPENDETKKGKKKVRNN